MAKTRKWTDERKWNREWFRALPIKAKLVWTYLWDECESDGIWFADYGTASFHLDFKISADDLRQWFGSNIYFFTNGSVLLIPYFPIQYGETKDTWSAKIKAREKLEALGFTVSGSGVLPPPSPHTDTTVGDSVPTLLNISTSKSLSIKKGGVGENKTPGFDEAFAKYPVRLAGTHARERYAEQIKTAQDQSDLLTALDTYIGYLAIEDWRRPKQDFATFLGTKTSGYFWRQWVTFDLASFAAAHAQKPKPGPARPGSAPPKPSIVGTPITGSTDWKMAAMACFRACQAGHEDDAHHIEATLGAELARLFDAAGGGSYFSSITFDSDGIRTAAARLHEVFAHRDSHAGQGA